MREQALMNRPQMPGGAANPVSQRRTIKIDPLPGINLRLTVQWQVIRVFGDEHVRDGRFRRQAAFDKTRWRRRLHHNVLAGAAGVFGTAHDQNPELRGYDVQPLADILADPVQRVLAARTGFVLDVDGRFDPWPVSYTHLRAHETD